MEWPGKDGKHPRCPPKGNVAKGNNKLVGYIFFLYGFRVALWQAHGMLVSFTVEPLELLWMLIPGITNTNHTHNKWGWLTSRGDLAYWSYLKAVKQISCILCVDSICDSCLC